jgi:hypothetical protein
MTGVRIVEVGPRDGLQNESQVLPSGRLLYYTIVKISQGRAGSLV